MSHPRTRDERRAQRDRIIRRIARDLVAQRWVSVLDARLQHVLAARVQREARYREAHRKKQMGCLCCCRVRERYGPTLQERRQMARLQDAA